MNLDALKADLEAATDGPWAACGDGKKVKPMPLEYWFAPVATCHNGIWWAKESGEWVHGEDARANARLIARAPAMAKALIAAARVAEIAQGFIDIEGSFGNDEADLEAFRKAMEDV